MWSAYLVALPFHRMWTLPGLGTTLQPPELVFLALLLITATRWWRRGATGPLRTRARITVPLWSPIHPAAGTRMLARVLSPVDYAVATWCGANLLALGLAPPGPHVDRALPFVEVAGSIYLTVLYALVRVTATRELLGRFASIFTLSGVVAALCGMVEFGLSWFGASTRLATIAITPIPYIGQAPRALGFTAHPQMLASILVLAVLLHVGDRLGGGWRRRDTGVLVLLVAGLVVTVSKTMICLLAGLAVMPVVASRGRMLRRTRWAAAAAWVVVALVFVVGSHVMVIRASLAPGLEAAQIVAGEPLGRFRWSGESWLVMPTTYVFNNQASGLAVKRAWPWGVGPAGHPGFVTTLQQRGEYPASISLTDPHSTYLGAAAELGTVGLVALLLLLATAGTTLVRMSRVQAIPRWTTASYAAAGAAFLIEATATDLMSCRHYWWLLGVVASWKAVSGSLARFHPDRREEIAVPAQARETTRGVGER